MGLGSGVTRPPTDVWCCLLGDSTPPNGGNGARPDSRDDHGLIDYREHSAVWSETLQTRAVVRMSQCRRRSFILATVVLLLAPSLLSCSPQGDRQKGFRQELETLERRTVPPEAEVLAHSGPVRSKWSVTASWDIETTLGKAEYSKWVISQLEPEFKAVRGDEAQLTFSKHTDGDIHSIECQFTPSREKLHVHVVFSAYPD